VEDKDWSSRWSKPKSDVPRWFWLFVGFLVFTILGLVWFRLSACVPVKQAKMPRPIRTGNRTAAEDISSEVFHRALANLQKYQWRGTPFVAWLFRIAANEVANHWQKTVREGGSPPPDVEETDPELERRAILFQLVERLPDDQRRVIEMRYGTEMSLLEVGEVLGKSEGAVKQLQRRALENLRAEMEGSHG
jgi:RNA polymerase sigma-70 factor (ECF subfamily)